MKRYGSINQQGYKLEVNVFYESVVGSLVYTLISTLPNIAHVVEEVGQYITNFRPLHWSALKWIFHYLNNTMDHGLSYDKSLNLPVVDYCNADYAKDIDTQGSTT